MSTLPPGPLVLPVRGPEYLSRDPSIDLSDASRVEERTIEPRDSSTIRGRVVFSNQAVARREIQVVARRTDDARDAHGASASVICKSDGNFSVSGITEGSAYHLFAYYRSNEHFSLAPALAGPVSARSGDSDVLLAVSPLCSWKFSIRDEASGAPIQDTEVRFQWWEGERLQLSLAAEHVAMLVTSDDGNYLVEGVPHGSVEGVIGLCIVARGYVPYASRSIACDLTAAIDLGTILLHRRPQLRVRVVDDSTSEPLAEADVLMVVDMDQFTSPSDFELVSRFGHSRVMTLFPNDRFRTDRHGQAEVSLVDGTACWLTVLNANYAPGRPIRIDVDSASLDSVHEFRLGKGGAVRVSVTGPDAKPRRGIDAELALDSEDRLSWMLRRANCATRTVVATNEAGISEFSHLSPGLHRVRIACSKESFAQQPWHDVLVEHDRTAEVQLFGEEVMTLSGEVLVDGDALRAAEVVLIDGATASTLRRSSTLESLAQYGRSTLTDQAGRYRFERVPTGDYLIQVGHQQLALAAEQPVRVDSIDTRQDIVLSTARISGTLVDALGHTVAGAQLCLRAAGDSIAEIVQGALPYAKASEFWIRSDGDGRYAIKGVQPDRELMVLALAEGMQPAVSEVIRLKGGQERVVHFVLQSAGAIEVHITSDRGLPAHFAGVDRIQAKYEGDSSMTVSPLVGRPWDPKGRPFVFEHVAPGTWHLQLVDVRGNTIEGSDQVVRVDSASVAIARFYVR